MFAVGEIIVYRNYDVCKIVKKQDMEIAHKVRPYYVLEPLYDRDLTFYAPVGNKEVESRMYHILCAEELHALLKAIPYEDTIWIENEKERKEEYKQILDGYNRTELLKMIKNIYLHQQKLLKLGKKNHASDQQFMKNAEKVLYNEFAYVLDLKPEEIWPFVLEKIEQKESK